jgi:photosystem II stability/assembly factor-like uncharacterized protein
MKNIFLFTSILLALASSAQTVDMDLFKGMNMRHIGPATMSGRVTAIEVEANDPRTIYVGTASGGLWKSETAGLTWNPIFDKQPVQSIGALALDQRNPDVIWAGTGEGNPRNSHTSGAGIFKSIDGGRSWKFKGLEGTKTIHRIIVHRDNPDVVYVAATGSAWGPGPDRGVFMTSDGGDSWKKILFVNDSTGCADLIVDPSNPNKMFAAMWEYGRKPYFMNSGGEGSGLYVTHDGGKNWVKRTDKDGLPKGNLGRIGLGISAENPDVIYALVEASEIALYKSINGGVTWTRKADKNAGNRPFYYADIYVNPHDSREIWSLWSVVTRSDDGGNTFETIIPYSGVHPDHHAFWISPTDPNFMLEGNDGGLNISRDGGNTWEYVSNLPLGQFYHINYDMDIPYHVYGGMQDNGSWQGPGYAFQWSPLLNEQWQEISFGDGFDVVSKKGDSRYAYSMWQEGNLLETDIETGQSRYIQPNHPDSVKLRFNWNAALAQDPFSECGLYFGTQFVHYTPDCGNNWKIISPDLTTNDSLKQKQGSSGGLTFDVTGAENYTTIISISPSPHDSKVLWVGTDDGNIQLTKDGGKTWNNVGQKIKGQPKNGWVPQIEVSPHNAGEAFVVMNNYRQNDWKPYVFHTTDFGAKWTRIVDETDVSGHALSLVQDPIEPKLLFLGTENGLYVSFNKGESWNKWTHDFPSVSTMDLKIHPRENDLIIGTFGRAAYILDDITPLRLVASKGPAALKAPLKIVSVPEAYLAVSKRPPGVHFPGDMIWYGENRWNGARIQYVVSLPEEAKADEKKKKPEAETADKPVKKKGDEIDVYVLTLEGDSLRHFTTKPDTSGVNLTHWGLERKGVNGPSWRERKSDDRERGGARVAPGTYRLVMVYGEHRDSTEIKVQGDPRLGHNATVFEAETAYRERWEKMLSKADKGFERLKEADNTIGLVKKQLANVPDSTKKELIAQADSISKVISELQSRFMYPEGTTGYRDESNLLTTFIWHASSYDTNGQMAPSENGLIALKHAERKVDATVSDINKLFSDAWNTWKAEIDGLEHSLFIEFEPIE